ncbi:MAG: BatA domain-containing protein [bacterium]
MIPLLAYPLALIALAALPALAAIYLLRNRFRAHPVSSLILWRTEARLRQGGSRIRQFQMPLLFFIELAVLALLVAAAVNPLWVPAKNKFPLVVVLDDSASMRAGDTRATARRAAIAELQRGIFSSVRFMIAGDRPRTLSPDTDKPGSWSFPDSKWNCMAARSVLDQTVSLAADLGGPNSLILVVSDSLPDTSPAGGRIKWLACGSKQGNVAFVNATRTPGPDGDRCMLEVCNLSDQPVVTTLTIDNGREKEQTRTALSLAARERRRHIVTIPAGSPAIRATLTSDALATDNMVWLCPATPKAVRAAINVTDPVLKKHISRAVESSGMISAMPGEPQIVFTDRDYPRTGSADTWVVRFHTGANPKAYVGPFLADAAHPVADGLHLDSLAWGADATGELAGTPVIMVGNIPLITDEEDLFGSHIIRFRFNPEASTLHEQPAWPSILWNIINWRALKAAGLETTNWRIDSEPLLTVARATRTVTVCPPRGRPVEIPASRGNVRLPTDITGLYSIVKGDNSLAYAVNLLNEEESDLTKCTSGSKGDWRVVETVKAGTAGCSWIFILAAIAMLGIHLLLISQKGAASQV